MECVKAERMPGMFYKEEGQCSDRTQRESVPGKGPPGTQDVTE